ncbi:MAG: hypothetical protein AAF571_15115 [Verrucomicrobiota bacterium]
MKTVTLVLISLSSLAFGFSLRGFLDSREAEKVDPQEWVVGESVLMIDAVSDPKFGLPRISGLTDGQKDEIQQNLNGLLILEVLQKNPEAAARLMQSQGPEILERYKNELIEAWRFHDPVAAYDWLKKHQTLFAREAFDRKKIMVLESMANLVPEQATPYLSSLESQEARDQLALALASGWASKDINQAFRALAGFENQAISNSALSQSYVAVFSSYAAVDPQDAKQLFGELEDEMLQQQLVQPLLRNLGQQNLDDAIQWSFNQASESVRNTAIDQLVMEYGYQNPEKLFTFAQQHSATLSEDSVIKMIGPLSEGSPERAISALEGLNSKERGSAAETAIGSWLRKDSDAALTWLNRQQDTDFRTAGAKAVSTHLAASDPVAATEWAFRVDDAAIRMDLILNVSRVANYEQLTKIEKVMHRMQMESSERAQITSLLDRQKTKFTSPLVVPF